MKVTKIDEIIGWIGTIAIVSAYALVSWDFVPSKGHTFQLINMFGALGLMWISYKKRLYQGVVLNIVWLGIGVVAILKLLL